MAIISMERTNDAYQKLINDKRLIGCLSCYCLHAILLHIFNCVNHGYNVFLSSIPCETVTFEENCGCATLKH